MLSEGARQLPLRHLSLRVPWNDTDWTGVVCQRPRDNVYCTILPRIQETRDDEMETRLAGCSFQELSAKQMPPCMVERGAFMAPYELNRMVTHPYSEGSPAHRHFAPTPFRHPPYSVPCIPFNWMLKEAATQKAEQLGLGFLPELEDSFHRDMGFSTDWVQDKHNQLVMMDTFFSAIQPRRSLCLFYAKRIPLAEDARRVVVGVGWVEHVGNWVEYEYSEPGEHRAILWERPVQHSIRPSMTDGFLMPYQEVLRYLDGHPEEDPAQFVAFVPNEAFWSFSYAAEHVTNDEAIAALLSCARALENCQRVVPGPWERVLEWIDARLNELWHMRGPCPGLGSALTAFGVPRGGLLAHELERLQAKDGDTGADPWPLVDAMFRNPASLGEAFRASVGPSLQKKWVALPDERRALLQLLSRFQLNADQATRHYVHEDEGRAELGISATDAEVLGNPYLLFEQDWMALEPIRVGTIDRGLFPEEVLRQAYPLPEGSRVDDPTDPRRVRAFVVADLMRAADEGDTLRPRDAVVRAIRGLEVRPPCPVDGDLMAVVEDDFGPVVTIHQMADGRPAYQLARLEAAGQVIRQSVQRRVSGRRHAAEIDWRARLDEVLPAFSAADDPEEELARREKAAALGELFASRLSVLVGPAGTGKTTLLSALCNAPEVSAGGVLLLAPTGKARVKMEQVAELQGAMTIAQFLLGAGRYYPATGVYRLSSQAKVHAGRTVVIDEASMLTEEQLAATLDALSQVDRLILVGDPRQLPPIGAGRPFLDIVRELAPESLEGIFPRVSPGYCELTIRRRHRGVARNDLLLAEWFSGRPVDAGADEIWSRLAGQCGDEHISLIRWDTADDLHEKLMGALTQHLGLSGPEDWLHFEQTLGGTQSGQLNYFWAGRDGEGGAGTKAEVWQLLSPVRGAPHGVDLLNRLIQRAFRKRMLAYATSRRGRKIPKPMGSQGILYGDKVINVTNHRRYDVFPKEGALRYIANGEIGIVVGQYKTRRFPANRLPWKLEVEFSTQPGFKYGYGGQDFGEESSAPLELAYALTVHKAQGSEFGITFVILPNPCRLLSRELLYTALTRQADKVIVLHQGDAHELKRFADERYSEAARRLTSLFRPPSLVEVGDRLFEEGLIHRTRRGECVRSKSEVIVADLLYSKGVDYVYELALAGSDGQVRYPDFTIDDDASGQRVYWEHLGMLRERAYRERWERKLEWYRQQGILPVSEGGGPNGLLVTSEDDPEGGIDSQGIERLIGEVLGV